VHQGLTGITLPIDQGSVLVVSLHKDASELGCDVQYNQKLSQLIKVQSKINYSYIIPLTNIVKWYIKIICKIKKTKERIT
jgi:hypothetical protein